MPLTARAYFDLIDRRAAAGQRELAHAMRVLCAQALPGAAPLLMGLSDPQLLEPRLFAAFSSLSSDAVPLGQLLLGGLTHDQRPEEVEVATDAGGMIFVPGLGYFRTDRRAQELRLRPGPSAGFELVDEDGRAVPHVFEAQLRVPDTEIELVCHLDPLMDDCLAFNTGVNTLAAAIEGPPPRLAPRPETHRTALRWALRIIEQFDPRYHAQIRACARTICLFEDRRGNSFAALGAHGAIFINVRWPATLALFIDEVCHQAGHVVFSAASTQRTAFTPEPDLPLAEITRDNDHRTVYQALHGVFTENAMCRVLRAVDESGTVAGPDGDEVFGRLAFAANKHHGDLERLARDPHRALTPLGLRLHGFYRTQLDALRAARPELARVDLRGQPYEFDVTAYRARNPSRRAV